MERRDRKQGGFSVPGWTGMCYQHSLVASSGLIQVWPSAAQPSMSRTRARTAMLSSRPQRLSMA